MFINPLATSSSNSFAFAQESIRSFVECLAFLQWSARTLITLIEIALALTLYASRFGVPASRNSIVRPLFSDGERYLLVAPFQHAPRPPIVTAWQQATGS